MPTLILLPGMDGTGRLFGPLIEAFGERVKTQVVTYPKDSTEDYPSLITRVRAELPKTGDYVLLGESFSGPIAIALAAESPPGLVGLVLCCTFAKSPRPQLLKLTPLSALLPRALLASMPAFVVLLGKYFSFELFQLIASSVKELSPNAFRARLAAVANADFEADLKRVTQPILYLRATADVLVPASSCKAICALQPATRVAEIEGPHFLLQSNPREASERICLFISK